MIILFEVPAGAFANEKLRLRIKEDLKLNKMKRMQYGIVIFDCMKLEAKIE